MIKKGIHIILLLALVAGCSLPLKAQYDNNWVLSDYLSINFSTIPPTTFSMPKSANSNSRKGSFSDYKGKLRLYQSDYYRYGLYSYPQNHVVYKAPPAAFQGIGYISSVFIAKPGSDSIVYVFHSINRTETYKGTYYVGVNLNCNNDSACLWPTETPIELDTSGGMLADATTHVNGQDVWYTVAVNDTTLHSYRITSSGVTTSPVVSYIYNDRSDYTNNSLPIFSDGALRFSHDGKSLVITGYLDSADKSNAISTVICDFDPASGKVSNSRPLLFNSDHLNCNTYGVEFSPNDSLIYITLNDMAYIYRIGNTNNIPSANATRSGIIQVNRYTGEHKQIISLGKGSSNRVPMFCGIQMGPNSKIYFYYYHSVGSIIGVINRPDEEVAGFNLEREVYNPAPPFITQFPNTWTRYLQLGFRSNLFDSPCYDTAAFTIKADTAFAHVTLFFGDGDSIRWENKEWEGYPTVKHYYNSEGKYFVRIKGVNDRGYARWYADTVEIYRPPSHSGLQLIKEPFCNGDKLTLIDSVWNTTYATINWGDGHTANFFANYTDTVINLTHHYFEADGDTGKRNVGVSIYNQNCSVDLFQELNIRALPKPERKVWLNEQPLKDSMMLCAMHPIAITDSTDLIDSVIVQINNNTYYWGNLQQALIIDPLPSGVYSLKTQHFYIHGCDVKDTTVIKVLQVPENSIHWLSDSAQCQTGNLFEWSAGSTANPYDDSLRSALWLREDVLLDTAQLNTAYSQNFSGTGLSNLTLVLKTHLGCVDSISSAFTLWPPPKANLQRLSDSIQCFKGNGFEFKDLSISADSVFWSADKQNGEFSGGALTTIAFADSGNYSVRFIAQSEEHCRDTQYTHVRVNPSPRVEILFENDRLCPEHQPFVGSVTHSEKVDFIRWEWEGQSETLPTGEEWQHRISGNTEVKAIAITDLGCADTARSQLVLYPRPQGVIQNPERVCVNKEALIQWSNIDHQLKWTINGQSLSQNGTEVNYSSDQTGTIKIQAIAINQHQCRDTFESELEVVPQPVAGYTTEPQQMGQSQVEWKLTADSLRPWESPMWTDGDFNLKSTNREYFVYPTSQSKTYLIVKATETCADTASVLFQFEPEAPLVPNIFSPNGDGLNDDFGIWVDQEGLTNYRLRVFSRWKVIVYESYTPNARWDGGEYQQDLYYWEIELQYNHGEKQFYNGVVMLVR